MSKPRQSFADWLREYGAGRLDDELTAALREVAEAVVLHDKAGKITLTISFSAQGGGVIASPKVTAAPPVPAGAGRFFYVTPDGALSTRDPRQPELVRPDGTPPDPMPVGRTSPTTTEDPTP